MNVITEIANIFDKFEEKQKIREEKFAQEMQKATDIQFSKLAKAMKCGWYPTRTIYAKNSEKIAIQVEANGQIGVIYPNADFDRAEKNLVVRDF